MRCGLWIVLAAVPAAAFAAGTVGHSSGRSGASGGQGLTVTYGRQTSHSNLSIQFRSSSSYSTSAGGCFYGGYPGGYYYEGAPGVYIYRGWAPYSPYLYRGVGPGVYRTVGPFSYVDAVVFSGSAGVPVFGYEERVREAAAAAQAASPPGPVPPEYQKLSAERLVDRGDDFFGRGEFERAVEAYRAAAAKKPDDPMAAFALGHGLFAAGAYSQAAAALRRGLRLYPAIVKVRMNRRDFYGDPGAFDEQLARLAIYVESSPAEAEARFLLGYNYFFSRQSAKAKKQFAALGDRDREAQLFLQELARAD